MKISNEYRELNEKLHEENPSYGTGGAFWSGLVWTFALSVGGKNCLDYGAGKRALEKSLLSRRMEVRSYDPCVPEISERPEPADIVVCTDVLEHIERDCLDSVLHDLDSLSKNGLFLAISTREGTKTLADGRNNHLIVEPVEWWMKRIPLHWDFRLLGEDEEKFWGTVDVR